MRDCRGDSQGSIDERSCIHTFTYKNSTYSIGTIKGHYMIALGTQTNFNSEWWSIRGEVLLVSGLVMLQPHVYRAIRVWHSSDIDMSLTEYLKRTFDN